MSLSHDQVIDVVKSIRALTYGARAGLPSTVGLADAMDAIADRMLEESRPRINGHRPEHAIPGCACETCREADWSGTLVGHPLARRPAIEVDDVPEEAIVEAAFYAAALDVAEEG